LERYSDHTVNCFFNLLHDWDEARILETFKNVDKIANSDALLVSLQEVLAFPNLYLGKAEIRSAVMDVIGRQFKTISFNVAEKPQILAGLLALVCIADGTIRSWASKLATLGIDQCVAAGWTETQRQAVGYAFQEVVQFKRTASMSNQDTSQPYAAFTARFWKLIYKLIRSLPAEEESRFISQFSKTIYDILVEEVLAKHKDLYLDGRHSFTGWTNAAITLNWFAGKYLSKALMYVTPSTIVQIVRKLLSDWAELKHGLATVSSNKKVEGVDTEVEIFTVFAWIERYMRQQLILKDNLAVLQSIYDADLSNHPLIEISEAHLHAYQRFLIYGLYTFALQSLASDDHVPFVMLVQFLNHQMKQSPISVPALEQFGDLLETMIGHTVSWLSKSDQDTNGDRGVVVSSEKLMNAFTQPDIYTVLMHLDHVKLASRILNSGYRLAYYTWRLENSTEAKDGRRVELCKHLYELLDKCLACLRDDANMEEIRQHFESALIFKCHLLADTRSKKTREHWISQLDEIHKRLTLEKENALLWAASKSDEKSNAVIAESLRTLGQDYTDIRNDITFKYLKFLREILTIWVAGNASDNDYAIATLGTSLGNITSGDDDSSNIK
jgi:hypothetical protein